MTALGRGEESGNEPPIIIISIDRKSYFLYKGEDHLNQLLLADGDFPKPVLCVHFRSSLDVKLVLGEGVNVSRFWGIHPQIIERLRELEELIETET
ncbi:hypothetical protein [Ostreiculturibacter nitratireducens]|uniref:hypothetical protein n=1 Tax=Ostreiculturibacter nitratireducens TaxID=3075226 RepID=UPI0031B64979